MLQLQQSAPEGLEEFIVAAERLVSEAEQAERNSMKKQIPAIVRTLLKGRSK